MRELPADGATPAERLRSDHGRLVNDSLRIRQCAVNGWITQNKQK